MKILIPYFQIIKNQVKWENLMSLSIASSSAWIVTPEPLLHQLLIGPVLHRANTVIAVSVNLWLCWHFYPADDIPQPSVLFSKYHSFCPSSATLSEFSRRWSRNIHIQRILEFFSFSISSKFHVQRKRTLYYPSLMFCDGFYRKFVTKLLTVWIQGGKSPICGRNYIK